MKTLFTSILLIFTVTSGFAQEVFVNPTSVTLTKQGTVTIVVTDNKGSSGGGSRATIGTLTATYTNAVSGYASNQGYNYITASSASTGTLDAGTYTVTTYNTPQQVTVILWEESASQGFVISQVELAYNSASTTDQAAFQAFISTLMQQQLAALQGQIDSQQNQITALQQSDSQQSSGISALQQQLTSLQSSYDQLGSQFSSLQSSLQTLQTQVSAIPAPSVSAGTSEKKTDDSLIYAGVGLGAAGVVGAIVNFFTKDASADSPAQTDDVIIQEGGEK